MLAFTSRVGRKVKLFHGQKSRGKHTATTVSVGRREFRETIINWPRPQLERLLNYRLPSPDGSVHRGPPARNLGTGSADHLDEGSWAVMQGEVCALAHQIAPVYSPPKWATQPARRK